MSRARMTILCLSILLVFLVGSASADSRIMYVDGDGGGVTASISNYTDYYFGTYDDTDFAWLLEPFGETAFWTSSFGYTGGDAPNYALASFNGTDVTIIATLVDDGASVEFFNQIGSSNYYQGAYISWNLGTEFPNFTIDVVTSSALDGVKLVPIPASVLLLGSGVLGLIALGRVRRRDL